MLNFKLYSSNVIVILRYYYNQTLNVVSYMAIRFITTHAPILHHFGDIAPER